MRSRRKKEVVNICRLETPITDPSQGVSAQSSVQHHTSNSSRAVFILASMARVGVGFVQSSFSIAGIYLAPAS
jgi:hypothetical protein